MTSTPKQLLDLIGELWRQNQQTPYLHAPRIPVENRINLIHNGPTEGETVGRWIARYWFAVCLCAAALAFTVPAILNQTWPPTVGAIVFSVLAWGTVGLLRELPDPGPRPPAKRDETFPRILELPRRG